MKKIFFLLLLVSACSVKGPLRIETIQVSPMVDRMENSEIVCYLVGPTSTICKWKNGDNPILFDKTLVHSLDKETIAILMGEKW